MSRSSRRRSADLDPQRVLAAAIDAFLDGESAERHANVDRHARRRVNGGAVALGVVIGIGARSLYRRAREFDLERVARAVEQRIVN
jgi:hypothetical protein